MVVTELRADSINRAKRAFTTRRVPQSHMRTLVSGDVRPLPGDLVLAIVEEIGSHKRIEMPTGRRAYLGVGDHIIVAYGNRYAPDQFEAIVGGDLGPCQLVAAGGVASTKICKHDRMREPTSIVPVGLIGNAMGAPINLSHYAINNEPRTSAITTILVAGTAMNAGKTMTSASLVRGFAAAGFKVAGIKSTGTGAGGDVWFMSDMGAHTVLDFTDAGMASTYLAPPRQIENGALSLISHAAELGCEIAVVEIADGLHHEETATLLQSVGLRHISRGLVFAANDALGAQVGSQTLMDWGHNVIAVSGQLTRSPLAIREARRATGLPVLTATEIQLGALNEKIMGGMAHRQHQQISFDRPAKKAASLVDRILSTGNAAGNVHPHPHFASANEAMAASGGRS